MAREPKIDQHKRLGEIIEVCLAYNGFTENRKQKSR